MQGPCAAQRSFDRRRVAAAGEDKAGIARAFRQRREPLAFLRGDDDVVDAWRRGPARYPKRIRKCPRPEPESS